MTNIVALIAATVLNLQTHLIPVKSNEALTDFAMIEQIPMTQAQRVEKAKKLLEDLEKLESSLKKSIEEMVEQDKQLSEEFYKWNNSK